MIPPIGAEVKPLGLGFYEHDHTRITDHCSAPPVTSGESRDNSGLTASLPYRGNPIHRRNHALDGAKKC